MCVFQNIFHLKSLQTIQTFDSLWKFRYYSEKKRLYLSQIIFLCEYCDFHIHWAFASDACLVRPGNGVISAQLQGKSATCLTDMQIAENSDPDMDNHIVCHVWPGPTWLGKEVLVETEVRATILHWHSMTKIGKFIWQMQICAFGDGDLQRSKVHQVGLHHLLSTCPQPPATKTTIHCQLLLWSSPHAYINLSPVLYRPLGRPTNTDLSYGWHPTKLCVVKHKARAPNLAQPTSPIQPVGQNCYWRYCCFTQTGVWTNMNVWWWSEEPSGMN